MAWKDGLASRSSKGKAQSGLKRLRHTQRANDNTGVERHVLTNSYKHPVVFGIAHWGYVFLNGIWSQLNGSSGPRGRGGPDQPKDSISSIIQFKASGSRYELCPGEEKGHVRALPKESQSCLRRTGM